MTNCRYPEQFDKKTTYIEKGHAPGGIAGLPPSASMASKCGERRFRTDIHHLANRSHGMIRGNSLLRREITERRALLGVVSAREVSSLGILKMDQTSSRISKQEKRGTFHHPANNGYDIPPLQGG